MSRLKRLLQEIHQRSLWQVLLVYLGASYAILEAVDLFIDRLGLPDWFFPLAAILLLIGLPVAVATALANSERGVTALEEGATAESETAEAPEATATAEAPRRARRLNWRTAISAGVVAFAAWGAVATGWLLFGDTGRTGAAERAVVSSPARVAVLPFSFAGSEELSYLGEGMVDLLSTKLDGAGELVSVDPRAVLGVAREGSLDPQGGLEIAERLGADYYVLGNVLEIGGQLQIDASLYQTERGPQAVAEGSAEGSAEEVFTLVDDLVAQFLAETVGSARDVVHTAAVTTDSLAALKEYLQGESAFRAGRFIAASEAFQRAVAIDSAFALAWYRLSLASEWLTRQRAAREAAEQAVRHSGRLSEHDRRLLEADLATRSGNAAQAEELYRATVGNHPRDVEAWQGLGEVLFHYGPLAGRPAGGAREAFERVLALEPDHVTALLHIVRMAAREGDLEALDSLARLFLEINPEGDRAVETRALRAYVLDDKDEQERVIAELENTTTEAPLMIAIWVVPTFGGSLQGGVELSRVLTASSRSPEVRAVGHVFRAYLQLAQGRWSRAQQEIAAAERLDPPRAWEFGALLAADPIFQVSAADIEEALAKVAALDPGAVRPSVHASGYLSAHNDYHGQLQAYLLGLLRARQGDHAAAERHAAELAMMESPEEAASLSGDLALGVRAYSAWSRGAYAEALQLLEGARRQVYYQLPITTPFGSQSLERYLRATLLEEAGQYEEAIHWYGSFPEISVYDLVFWAPSHLRRAEIYERLGERERAAFHYNRFVELWSEADPELRFMVDHAAARLAGLTGEPPR
jgi:tetratricopeptide (TPR) repeat protein